MVKATKRGKKWRVQVYDYTDDFGKRHYRSITADTKARAEYLAAEYKVNRKPPDPNDYTVGEAIDKYIELKSLLSPTTLQAYKTMREFAFQDLMPIKVSKLTDMMMQEAINKESTRVSHQTGKPLSPKSVKNEYSLLSGALKEICHVHFYITLPTIQHHIKELPEVEDVIHAIIGTDIELPCMLSLWLSLSMSEIRGLMCSDIRVGYLIVDRVIVDVGSESIVKDNAKVETRLRKHKLPSYLLSLVTNTDTYKNFAQTGENAPLISYNRRQIYDRWKNLCKTHGLGDLSFHSLRHINCSVMASLQISEKVILERGGWKSSYVPKSVYTHSFTSDRIEADRKIDDFFEASLKNATKNATKILETS